LTVPPPPPPPELVDSKKETKEYKTIFIKKKLPIILFSILLYIPHCPRFHLFPLMMTFLLLHKVHSKKINQIKTET